MVVKKTSGTAKETPGLVLVVDDDASLCNSLRNLLGSVGFDVMLFESADEVLTYTFPQRTTCMLLDVYLKGQSGLDLQAKLAERQVDVPIIFMTGFGDIPMSVSAMKAGAHDFLAKPVRDQDLLDAVGRSLERDRCRRAHLQNGEDISVRYKTLTPRECEVMVNAVNGMLNKQIAAAMGISEVTVKIHRGNVMKKMHARNFAELVLLAQRLGLCTMPR